MTPEQFITKWHRSPLNERAAAQSHFNDLCQLLDVKSPIEDDPSGREYRFEKPVRKISGGKGFVDVWKNNCFGWEYKGPRKNLVEAYAQLKQYTDDLKNPPLLIVSDMQEIRIHTNFTKRIVQQKVVQLPELISHEARQLLRWCFTKPERLEPTATHESVTAEAAASFGKIGALLRSQYHDQDRRVSPCAQSSGGAGGLLQFIPPWRTFLRKPGKQFAVGKTADQVKNVGGERGMGRATRPDDFPARRATAFSPPPSKTP